MLGSPLLGGLLQPELDASRSSEEEEQPSRGTDYDDLGGWARLSVSPRLFPTSYSTSSTTAASLGLATEHGTSFGSYRGLSLGGESPLLGPVTSVGGVASGSNSGGGRRESSIFGLSPLLGPSHYNSGSGSGSSKEKEREKEVGYDYSTFGQYHTAPPSGHHRSSISPPMLPSHHSIHSHFNGTSKRLVKSGSPHSFSGNVDFRSSVSPQSLPLPLHASPPLLPSLHHTPSTIPSSLKGKANADLLTNQQLDSAKAAAATFSPSHPNSNPTPTTTTPGGEALRMPTPPPTREDEEDPRIRAYAKLEFPTFDIYIQKLSVIVGRRPASNNGSLVLGRNGSGSGVDVTGVGGGSGEVVGEGGDGAKEVKEEVKLEDFVMGLGVDDEKEKDKALAMLVEEPSTIITNGEKEEKESKEGTAEKESKEGTPTKPTSTTMDLMNVPSLAFTPSSPAQVKKTSPAPPTTSVPEPTNDEIAFDEFLKSSPTLAPTDPATNNIATESIPSLPTTSEPVISTSSSTILTSISTVSPPVPEPVLAPTTSEPLPLFLPTPTLPTPPIIQTDIDLGPIRAVSRQHARLYFDYEMGGWAIEVLGRNGVVVEGNWKAKGEKQALGKRTKIQIAERIFHFVLPTVELDGEEDTVTGVGASDSRGLLKEEELSSDSNGSSDGEGEGDEGGDGDSSSSLSDVSDDEIELSPILSPELAIKEEEERSTLPSKPTTLKLKLGGGGIGKGQGKGIGKGKGGKGGKSALARAAALAPPVRAAARNATYGSPGGGGAGGVGAGKKVEVLQAARAGGKGKSTLAAIASTSTSAASTTSTITATGPSVAPPTIQKITDKNGRVFWPRPHAKKGKGGYVKKKDRIYEDEEEGIAILAAAAAAGTPKSGTVTLPVSGSSAKKNDFGSTTIVSTAKKGPQKQPKKEHLVASSSSATSSTKVVTPPLPPLPPLTSTASTSTSSSGPPQSHLPGSPFVKRGRGRPPKNGVCAQRSSKKSKGDDIGSPTSSNGGMALDPELQEATPTPTPASPLPAVTPALPPTTDIQSSTAPASAGATSSTIAAVVPPTPALASGSTTPAPTPASSTSAAASTTSAATPVAATPGPSASATTATPAKPTPAPNTRPAPYHPAPEGETPLLAAPADDPFAKPPYTYASLIAQAVSSVETRKLTLNGIYDWITARWPYFSDNQNGWQNSIRHNLTLSRGFLKIPRREDEGGKGAFWAIDPAQIRNFDGLHFRKKTIRPTNAPSGPSKPQGGKPLPPKPKQMAKPVPRPNGAARPTPTPSLATPLPIIISPIPDSYVRPAPAPSATPPDDLTAALLKDPPIILHEGKLILNPTIFAHLEKEQLDNLQVLPASQALQILQAYVVQHFKEKMRRMAVPKPAAPPPAAGASTATTTPGSSTTPATANGTPAAKAVAAPSAVAPAKPAAPASNGVPAASTPSPSISATAKSTEVAKPSAPAKVVDPAPSTKRKLEEQDSDIEVIEPAPKVAKVGT